MTARFLCDVMCGKLATYLRMCGHDAAYALDRGVEADDAIRAIAAEEDRVLLTRDADLAARTEGAILLDATGIEAQLRAVRDAGHALSLGEPTRCAACNGRLDPVSGPTPEHAPDADERRVWRCRDCGKFFWRGSHWADVRERLAGL